MSRRCPFRADARGFEAFDREGTKPACTRAAPRLAAMRCACCAERKGCDKRAVGARRPPSKLSSQQTNRCFGAPPASGLRPRELNGNRQYEPGALFRNDDKGPETTQGARLQRHRSTCRAPSIGSALVRLRLRRGKKYRASRQTEGRSRREREGKSPAEELRRPNSISLKGRAVNDLSGLNSTAAMAKRPRPSRGTSCIFAAAGAGE